jgi:hypothetical protein
MATSEWTVLQQIMVPIASVASFMTYVVVAMFLPAKIRIFLSRRRRRWLERCQAVYMLGLNAINSGDIDHASSHLDELKEVEGRWQARHTPRARYTRAVLIIASTSALCVAIKMSPIWILGASLDPGGYAITAAFMMVLTANSYFFMGYEEDWLFASFHDRLKKALGAGKDIGFETFRAAGSDDLQSLCEIFGLSTTFTRKQLDRARRRLASELHPDRWPHAKPSVRHAREEALKGVNAAYEKLRGMAA